MGRSLLIIGWLNVALGIYLFAELYASDKKPWVWAVSAGAWRLKVWGVRLVAKDLLNLWVWAAGQRFR